VDTQPSPRGSPLLLAVLVSLVVHVVFGAVIRVSADDDDAEPAVSLVDIEIAPIAPPAEPLGPDVPAPPAEEVASRDEIVPPEPAPPPEPPPPKEDDRFARDAGVPDAAPPPEPEPADAGVAVAVEPRDAGPPQDGGDVVATAEPADGGVPGDAGAILDDTPPASAATAANLLGHFPSKHLVSVLLRFDRLRGTEWSPVLQKILSAMPDYKALIADPEHTVVADRFDLVAMSSARPKDSGATILAVKSSMTAAEVRDFLDEPGAPVTWSRVTGGVLGTRGVGDRVQAKDQRVFLVAHPGWTVLAKPKDLKGALDPIDGDLDAATVDVALLPPWLQHLPEFEAESGVPDGPAVLMTFAPKSKRWELPPIGLAIEELPAPKRLTLTAQLDTQGFVIRGNLEMRSVEDAEELVKGLEATRTEALDSTLMASLLKKMKALNLVSGLTLVRTDARVSYSTSISIADARKLFPAGADFVVEYFESLKKPDPDEPEPTP